MMESTLEFLRQGGYAFFVWGAFGVTFVLLIAETVQLRRNRRTILARVGRLVRLSGARDTTPSHSTSSPKAPAEPRGE
ncbi:MAG: heme exporter protein CcmD [Thiohalocapsa sp.]